MSAKDLQLAGLHDFSPDTMLKRQYLIDVLQDTFKQYGFLPMQTPAIERLDVLTDKYGQEGEQLLFKIVNSGDFLAKTTEEDYRKGYKTMLPKIAKKGLRYDLTIPLARYIATHRSSLTLPFKRFQIQPVWRAERPQKDRYREFYQCDVDIIGTPSLLCEAEILKMIVQVADRLGLKRLTIQLNHRLIFKALAAQFGAPEQESVLCRTLDKLDKLGEKKVIALFEQQGLSTEQLKKIEWIFRLQGTIQDCIPVLTKYLNKEAEGQKALADLEQLVYYTQALDLSPQSLTFTPTLARGMDYYTGIIFEVKAAGIATSLGGGGRYDNLTTLFGLEPLPGIGFSFGLERLYNVLEQNKLIPAGELSVTSVLLVPFTKKEEGRALHYLHALRKGSMHAEMYPIGERLQKALNYAVKKHIPWVAIIGAKEVESGMLSLRYMPTGERKTCAFEEMSQFLRQS